MLADGVGGLVHSAWCVCKGVRWGRHNEIHEGEMRSASVCKTGGGRAGKHACAAVGGIRNHPYGNPLIHNRFHQILLWPGETNQVAAGR